MASWIKLPLDMEVPVGLSPGDIVLHREPSPPPPNKKMGGQQPPTFWPMYCGQTAGWMTLPLGTEIGLGLGHTVLDGDPASPSADGHSPPPIFGPCLLWPNGWLDQDATWYRGRPRPRQHCLHGDPSPPKRGDSSLPLFGPCIVAKRLDA